MVGSGYIDVSCIIICICSYYQDKSYKATTETNLFNYDM
jgi:hypothetical protein